MSSLTAAVLLAWVVIVLQAFAIGGLIRQIRILSSRDSTTNSQHRLAEREVPQVVKEQLGMDLQTIVLGLDANCSSCRDLLTHWQMPLDLAVHWVVVARGFEDEHSFARLKVNGVPIVNDMRGEVFRALGIRATPMAMLVSQSGQILDASAVGSIAGLLKFARQVSPTGREVSFNAHI